MENKKSKHIRTDEHNRKIAISNKKENLSEQSIRNKRKGSAKRSKNTEYLKKLSVANRGENALNHKVTEKDVREIKQLWETGSYTSQSISERYPISRQSVRDIITGRTWKHVK